MKLNENNLNTIFNIESDSIEIEVSSNNEKEISNNLPAPSTNLTETSSIEIQSLQNSNNINEVEIFNDLANIKKSQFEFIDKAKNLLDISIEIATISQHPNSILAASTLLSSITNANDLITKINLNLLKLKYVNYAEKDSQINIDKAVFVGSTADLQKILKGKNNE